MKKVCLIKDCDNPARTRGLCKQHYLQHYREGTLNQFKEMRESPRWNWLKDRINYKDKENCLIWPFGCDKYGSAEVQFNNRIVNAHRAMCELAHGSPPAEKHQARRSCRNKLCVNPNHVSWQLPPKAKSKILTGWYHWPAVWIHSHLEYEGEDCLFWPFQRHKKGYGKIHLQGLSGRTQTYAPHAIMCELKRGDKPSPEYQVAHSCGNGFEGCVNPNHLFWKTQEQNAAEKAMHIKIRKSNLSNKQLARKYGLTESLISCIRREYKNK